MLWKLVVEVIGELLEVKPKFVIVDSAGDVVGFGAKGAVQNNYGNAGGGWHKWATDVIT